MRALDAIIFVSLATCSFGLGLGKRKETCNINFMNSETLTCLKTDKSMAMLQIPDDSDWFAFLLNDQEAVLKTPEGIKSDLEDTDPSVLEKFANLDKIQAISYKDSVVFMFAFGQFISQSLTDHNWVVSQKKGQYIVRANDGQQLILNIQGPSEYHHLMKHANGLLTAVDRNCFINIFAQKDDGYEAISSQLERVMATLN